MQPEILRLKVYEPVLVASEEAFSIVDIRVRVKGGGHTFQVYAIRQAIAKALVAYYAKYVDAYSAMELKKKLVAYDRTLLIADPRRAEPKKFGGHGARARRQKRYVACRVDIVAYTDLFLQLPLSGSRAACLYPYFLFLFHALHTALPSMHMNEFMPQSMPGSWIHTHIPLDRPHKCSKKATRRQGSPRYARVRM